MIRLMVAGLFLSVLLAADAAGQGKKEELASTGWGTLKGVATYDGTPPPASDPTVEMKKHKDAACCLAGKGTELVDQTWLVNKKNNGVANVVVYLKPAPDTFFKIKEPEKVRKDVVTMDQPHCAFIPHVVALYPVYFDGKSQTHTPTGQVFKVLNSATVAHNYRITGDPTVNVGANQNLPPNASQVVDLKPQRLPLLVNCDYHKWMSAKVWVFDHPYFAVTKEDGSYEIPNVPTGVQLSVHAWHEGMGYVIGGKNGIPTTLKDGVNVQDFKLKSAD